MDTILYSKVNMRSTLLMFLFLLTYHISLAQSKEKATLPSGLLINVTYAVQLPGGDLADRFNYNFSIGGQLTYLHSSNYFAGLEGTYLFGNAPKEDVLSNLRTESGLLIDQNGDPAKLFISEAGYYLGAKIGKLIPLGGNKRRSMLEVSIGMGFLQHQILFVDNPGTFAPLQGEYKKGYDRLTNGLALRQYIGYRLFSRNRLINFSVGFEFTEGFTKNRRDWNFDTMEKDDKNRLDLLYGLRLGWTLPIWFAPNDDGLIFY